MEFIPSLLISIPIAILVIYINIEWIMSGLDDDLTLMVLMSILLGPALIGRIWYKYYERKKQGEQSKLDDFKA